MPVYHRGWVNFFAKYPQVQEIVLLDTADLQEFAPTHKDLHGLSIQEIKQILASLKRFSKIQVMSKKLLQQLQIDKQIRFVIPKDEVVRSYVERYLPAQKNVIESDIFLRWTKESSLAISKVKAQKNLSFAQVAKDLQLAQTEGEKSSDWWRRVGCVLCLANGEKIITHNTHLPESQTPYIKGDVRAQFHKGDHFELTTAIHAEAKAIALAAKDGCSTDGATIIVTDFPCPVCAKLIAQAGIKKVYFQKGYVMLDGEEILCAFDVEIVHLT
ncbi:MAG: deaminase [bacterium]|nr:deaminase [bacterium]